MLDQKQNIALEEFKLLQEVIARHEAHAMRVKGWLLVVMAGLAAAIYSQGISATKTQLFLGSAVIALLFLVWELFHRAIGQLAINRSKAVEKHLQDPSASRYDGPRIGESLSHRVTVRDLMHELTRPWNWSSLVVVFASLTFLVIFAPPPKIDLPIAQAKPSAPVIGTAPPASQPAIPVR